jgi:lipid-binding SYLF domain-containing protein
MIEGTQAMNRLAIPLGALVLLLSMTQTPAHAGDQERKTVDRAVDLVRVFSTPRHGIPGYLLRDAAAVAVIPQVVKAGLIVDRRIGHGVLMVRQADGRWSHPVFVTLEGGGVGLEAGFEKSDLMLVIRSPAAVDRILHGRGQLKLGGDLTVTAGPIGGEAEAAGLRRAEIYAYSHSRGLFAGLSLEGNRLHVNAGANDAFYSLRGGRPDDVLRRNDRFPAAEALRAELDRLTMPPPPPVVPVRAAQPIYVYPPR